MNYYIKYFVADSLSDMQYPLLLWLLENRDTIIQHVISTRIRPIEVLIIYTKEQRNEANSGEDI